jgi:hypothetical protein
VSGFNIDGKDGKIPHNVIVDGTDVGERCCEMWGKVAAC